MIRYFIFLSLLIISTLGYSQNSQTEESSHISGSLESNSIYYLNDSLINAVAPKDKIGSNSYFKLDFNRGNFSAGMQYEAYLSPLVGYSPLLEGSGVVSRYATYNSGFISVTAGNYYEQFGSGLIFRSYEERSLGINNSLDGVSIKLKPTDFIEIKTVVGKQRKNFDLSNSNIRGADVELNISQSLMPESSLNMSVGGSWLSKYEKYTGPVSNFPTTVNAYAGRLQVSYRDYYLYSELVQKGKDPAFVNLYSNAKGSAYIITQSITAKGFGTVLSIRRLENIDFRSERDEMGNNLTLNYLPALTKQHRYPLANLHPYSTRAKGEIGGQLDLYYKFEKETVIGGIYGLNLDFNFSTYYTLGRDGRHTQFVGIGDTLLFRDFSVEIEKRLTHSIKGTISYISQRYNKGAIIGGNNFIVEQVAVADFQFKISQKSTMKTEISELWGDKGEDDWSHASLEFSVLPKWTFFVSDMIQHRSTKIHYFNGGLSFNYTSTKISLAFGRSREGIQCVNGMCRFMPAYTGINLSMVTSF